MTSQVGRIRARRLRAALVCLVGLVCFVLSYWEGVLHPQCTIDVCGSYLPSTVLLVLGLLLLLLGGILFGYTLEPQEQRT